MVSLPRNGFGLSHEESERFTRARQLVDVAISAWSALLGAAPEATRASLLEQLHNEQAIKNALDPYDHAQVERVLADYPRRIEAIRQAAV